MKTQIALLAALLIGGLVITSCQKDNSLFEDQAIAQNLTKNEFSGSNDTIVPDPIRNYPDPFLNTTIIEYRLQKTEYVRLSVHNNETGWAHLLNEGLQAKGLHAIKFEAFNLPKGEYSAVLKIGNKEYVEVMTKKGFDTYQDVQDESPSE